MTFIKQLNKYKQTILMTLSLLLIIGFFIPWVVDNPSNETFAKSDISMSGIKIFTGYHELVSTFKPLVEAMGYPKIALLLNLGYILILLPLSSLVALIFNGLRLKQSLIANWIAFITHAIILGSTLLVIVLFKDLRILFYSLLSFTFGFYLVLLIALLGVAVLVLTRKK